MNDTTHEHDAQLDPHEIEQRIRQLHQDGLKVRDISSLTNTHPLIVERIVATETRQCAIAR